MKILILTSRFGMGHLSAAKAIEEELKSSNSNDIIQVVDIIQFLFPITYKFIYSVFNNFICKFLSIYNCVNKLVTKDESDCVKKRTLIKMDKLFKRYKPDLIIATWSAASRYTSNYKEEYNVKTPLYTYITDVTAHKGWITSNTDMYFVATNSTREQLVSKGIDKEKIIINGIPVRKVFKEKVIFNKASSDKKEILIMGGGLGLIANLDNILDKLYYTSNINITVITCKNKKLFNKLKENYPNMNVVGYTNKVEEYMRNADLLITKPGGITTFEAIYTNIPLYVMRPFLAQEVGNAEFIEKMNIGKVVWKNNFDIADDIIVLLKDDESLNKMKYEMRLLKGEIGKFNIRETCERNYKNENYYTPSCSYSVFYDIWNHAYTYL